MKKCIYILSVALAVAAACTKSEVTYDQQESIAIKPMTSGMTKAAVGTTPTGQELLIYANYEDGRAYLNKAVFSERTTGIWMGADQDYFWPKSGLVKFAGCTNLPAEYGTVDYSFSNNQISVANYKQDLDPAKTVDFLWFNQTEAINNGLTGGATLEANFSHALTWVTIQGAGFGGSVGWKIKSITLKGVQDKGSLTCKTTGPQWEDVSETAANQTFTVYSEADPTKYITLGENPANIETKPGGTVLIPQTPVTTMTIEYSTGSAWKTKDLDLKISDDPTKNFWEAGKHYVYTITFNPYKITFNVTENTWENGNPVDENGVPKDDIDVDSYKDSEINP